MRKISEVLSVWGEVLREAHRNSSIAEEYRSCQYAN